MTDTYGIRERFARLREQMAASPPDERYAADVEEWQADGWS